MCGGADPKREDGHQAHVANGGDRVRDRDLGEARLLEGGLQSREKGGWVYVWAWMPRLASSTWGRALQKQARLCRGASWWGRQGEGWRGGRIYAAVTPQPPNTAQPSIHQDSTADTRPMRGRACVEAQIQSGRTGHRAHRANGGDRVTDCDCAEIRAAIICGSANLRRVCRDYDMAIRIRCDRAAACACCYCQSHCGRPEHIQRTVPLPEDCSMRHCSGKRQRTPKGVHG